MRKLVLVISFIFVGNGFLSIGVTQGQGFYDFQKAGKSIDKIKNILLSQEELFTYGFQPYNQKKIASIACFFNQPSNMLHYVLTNDKNYTLHFLVPVLDIDHVNTIYQENEDKSLIEIVYKDQSGMKVKEHNSKGNIIFSLRFTSYHIPVPKSTNLDDLAKVFNKLIKKASKYQAQK
ncbi:MAG: hypothetical protein ACI8SE_001017 [Bacteroidia bacterium]|jgi:hypothetical protein